MRRKKRNGVVAPVVGKARGRFLWIELEYRQELDRRYAQILKVGNLLDEAGVGPALFAGDA